MRSWGGIDGHDHCGDRGLDFASIEAMIVLDRVQNRAAIGPQSRVDRGSSRKTTAVRWRLSWAFDQAIHSVPCRARVRGKSGPSDGDHAVAMCPRNAFDREGSRPSTPCLQSQNIATVRSSYIWWRSCVTVAIRARSRGLHWMTIERLLWRHVS